MQFDQSENFFTDDVQVNLHVRSSNLQNLNKLYSENYFRDEWIKSRDYEVLLFEIYCTIVTNISRTYGGW